MFQCKAFHQCCCPVLGEMTPTVQITAVLVVVVDLDVVFVWAAFLFVMQRF